MGERGKDGKFVKGIVPWNKSKKNVYSSEALIQMSLAKKGKRTSPSTEFKKGQKPWCTGLKGVLKANNTSFKKGRILPSEIAEKCLANLREKIMLKPDLSPSEDLGYILGMLKGDGCVFLTDKKTYRIALDITEGAIAWRFFKALRAINLNPFIRTLMPSNGIGKKKKYLVLAHSKQFGEWYKRLTLGDLSELLISKEVTIGFLCGFYEAEGSIYVSESSKTISMSNTDKALLKVIKESAERIGFSFSLYGPYKNKNSLSQGETKELYRIDNTKQSSDFINLIQPCCKSGGVWL